MAIAALLHSLRSQTKQLASKSFHSGYHPCRFGTWPHIPSAKPNLNSVTQLAAAQKRWASKSTVAEDDKKISIGPQKGREVGEDEKDTWVVYYGPNSSTIKKAKHLALITCCFSVSFGTVMTERYPDPNFFLKAYSFTFLCAAATASLNFLSDPYIHKLMWQPGSDSFEVKMLSRQGKSFRRTIRFADIRPPETNRPFVTFKANGNFYFVDADHCHNKALLARLTPQKATNESASKNL